MDFSLIGMIMIDAQESYAEEMSCKQMEADKAVLSDKLYNLAMELTDMGAVEVDKFIREECRSNGISYPPKQLGAAA